jgi:hypothetical protein
MEIYFMLDFINDLLINQPKNIFSLIFVTVNLVWELSLVFNFKNLTDSDYHYISAHLRSLKIDSYFMTHDSQYCWEKFGNYTNFYLVNPCISPIHIFNTVFLYENNATEPLILVNSDLVSSGGDFKGFSEQTYISPLTMSNKASYRVFKFKRVTFLV